MFNVFAYEKQLYQTQQFEHMKDKYMQDEVTRRRTQSRLANNYKKRVENFVLQMVEKPVINHDHVPAVVKIRDEDPSKFKGPANVIIRSFRHEKDRIKENIESYKQWQIDYKSTPFEFRKRDLTKEIQPMMRFTSKTNFERMATRLNVLMNGTHPHQLSAKFIPKSADKLSDSFIMELSKSPEATNKYLATHVLPDFNAKTHFKATHSLFLGLPDVMMEKAELEKIREKPKKTPKTKDPENPTQKVFAAQNSSNFGSRELDLSEIPHSKVSKDSLPNIKQVTMAQKVLDDEEEKRLKEIEKNIHIETLSPIEASKKVLLKCNIIKPKRPNLPALPKGGGHLSVLSERSQRDIYRDVLHKNV